MMDRAKNNFIFDVDSVSLKIIQVIKAASGFQVTRALYHPFLENQASLRAQKKSILEVVLQSDIRGSAVMLLPGAKTRALSFTLPEMPQQELAQAVAWKVKQNLPAQASFEQVSFDYISDIPAGGSHKEIPVLAFVARKEDVAEEAGLFGGSLLKLETVMPRPYCTYLALSRLGQLSAEETCLILDIGSDESSVVITRAGWPVLMRPLCVSGNNFTDAIAAYLRVHKIEARALKMSQGLAALSSQLESMVVDLEHTFKFSASAPAAGSFDRAILCGQEAKIAGLDIYLSEKLAVPVRVFDPLSASGVSFSGEAGPLAKENSCAFCAALGAALNHIAE